MQDPYFLLGVSADDSDEAIHRAYLLRLRETPPERDAEAFQRLRDAYEQVRTLHRREAYALFGHQPPTLDDLLEAALATGPGQRPTEATLRNLLKDTHWRPDANE